MALFLPELDLSVRERMLLEFEREESNPYRSKLLTLRGRHEFPLLMRRAIIEGDDDTLGADLAVPGFWLDVEPLESGEQRRVNPVQFGHRLARVEFNTWYVRALSGIMLDEGADSCLVYRAFQRSWDPECPNHDGAVVSTAEVYHGHRARYWPASNPSAFSIPSGPGCGHSIHRLAV